MRAARGDLIAYLGNDDEFLPGVFEHVAWMAERVDFDALLFSSYTYFVNEKKCVLQTPATKDVTPATLLEFGTVVGLQNIFYRSRVFDSHSFDVNNRYSMDYQLLWDLVLDTTKRMFVFSDRIASINYFEGNLSHDNPRQAREAMEIAQARMGAYAGPVWFQGLLPPPPPLTFWQRVRRRLSIWMGLGGKQGGAS